MRRNNLDGISQLLLDTVNYNTGVDGIIWLDSETSETDEGRYWCLIARNGDVTIKATTTVHAGQEFPADIILSPGHIPIYGNFKKVIIDDASAGVLEIHPRLERL